MHLYFHSDFKADKSEIPLNDTPMCHQYAATKEDNILRNKVFAGCAAGEKYWKHVIFAFIGRHLRRPECDNNYLCHITAP